MRLSVVVEISHTGVHAVCAIGFSSHGLRIAARARKAEAAG